MKRILIAFGILVMLAAAGIITVKIWDGGIRVFGFGKGIEIEFRQLLSETEKRIRAAEIQVAEFESYCSSLRTMILKATQGISQLEMRIGEFDRLVSNEESILAFIKSRLEKGEDVYTATLPRRILTSDELLVYVEQSGVKIRTAQDAKNILESELAFLREELKKYEADSLSAPVQLMELQGSLANLHLQRDIHKDRLAMIDNFRTPDAQTLYADARAALDTAFSGFETRLGTALAVRIDTSGLHADDLRDKNDVVVQKIKEFMTTPSVPGAIAALAIDTK